MKIFISGKHKVTDIAKMRRVLGDLGIVTGLTHASDGKAWGVITSARLNPADEKSMKEIVESETKFQIIVEK